MEESSGGLECFTPPSKRIKIDSNSLFRSKDKSAITKKHNEEKENAIVIDSDEDDFVEKSLTIKSDKKTLSSSKKPDRTKLKKSIISPKYSLESVFEKVKNKTHVRESVDWKNDEERPVNIAEDTNDKNSQNSTLECIEGSKSAGLDLDRRDWSCSQCTYLNHTDLTYCEMCETPKKCRAVSHVSDDIQNKNSSTQGTSCMLLKSKNRNIVDITEETVTNKINNGELMVDGMVAFEKEEEGEEVTHLIDDTIDYDPGDDACYEDDEKIEESDELEPEDDKNDDNIDEYCRPASDDAKEENDDNDKMIEGKIEMSGKQKLNEFEMNGYENSLSSGSCYEPVDEEFNFATREQSETSESMYFNKTELSCSNTTRFKRKEVIIANNLKLKLDNASEKKIQETECAKIVCSKETADKQEIQTGTPTSGKKYRFKSLRRNRSPGSSPIVSSPNSYLGNENFQNKDRLETGKSMVESQASAGDRIKCKHHEISGEEFTKSEKAGKHRRVNPIDTGKETDMESDLIATPNSEQLCKDYSFSSPEFDEMLVTETEDIASNGMCLHCLSKQVTCKSIFKQSFPYIQGEILLFFVKTGF